MNKSELVNAIAENADLSTQHRAVIDTTLPGLRVVAESDSIDDFSERPVWLWNRRNFCNALIRTDIGRPDSSDFVPFDLMLRSQIDENENKYMRVIGTGSLNGLEYVRVCGVHFHDLPSFGSLRVLSPDGNHNQIFRKAGLNVINNNGSRIEVIHGHIKKTLDLSGMEIHCNNPVDPGST